MDFSDNNYSLVEKIQNLTTGYISTQYHIVFADMFHTVFGTGEYEEITVSILNNGFEKKNYVEE